MQNLSLLLYSQLGPYLFEMTLNLMMSYVCTYGLVLSSTEVCPQV